VLLLGDARGAELDLLVVMGGKRLGFAIKLSAAPGVTASMRTALVDLQLDSLDVIHTGRETYPLTDRIRAVALSRLHEDVGGASKARGRPG
jgi:predicted AAA+ superfamily ATPase